MELKNNAGVVTREEIGSLENEIKEEFKVINDHILKIYNQIRDLRYKI